MRGASDVGRQACRLTAVALLAVLILTGIHGSASLAAPTGAIASCLASIGAALQHPSGCGMQRDGDGGRTVWAQASEEPPERAGVTDLPSATPVELPAPAIRSSSLPVAEPDHLLEPEPADHHQGRAPPA